MNNSFNISDFIKPDLKKTFEEISSYIERIEKERNAALERAREWEKDEEVQKLKEEIENVKKKNDGSVSFTISAKELDAIDAWAERHIKEKHNNIRHAGAIGGRYSYKFCPTSIGDTGEVICTCGDKFCFRDLD